MVEKKCDLWMERADYRCIVTSGAVSGDGEAFLETPSAVAAGKKFAGIAGDLGRMLTSRGTHCHFVRPDLIAFPVKQFQWQKPQLPIIQRSVAELIEMVGDKKTLLPRPGCEPGELTWEEVAPALEGLPENIIVVSK